MQLGAALRVGFVAFGITFAALAQEVKGPATLPPVAPGHRALAAFPTLSAGGDVTAAVAARVNASLARLDASAVKAAAECRKDARANHDKPAPDAWTRTVAVTMRGPRYLSMIATDSYYCGGAYPTDGATLPIVYDLSTGSPVNWLKYLPAGATSALSESADGAKTGVVIWPALMKRARDEAETECKDSFADDAAVQFMLWLDASSGKIVAQPDGFAHAIAACAATVEIPVAEARKMGFHGDVLEALDAAKKLQ